MKAILSDHLLNEIIELAQRGKRDKAIALIEEGRHLLETHAPPIKVGTFNGAVLKGRTRFFLKYAHHGLRLSALVFLVAHSTRTAWKRGARSQKSGWHQKAEWFGEQIGCGRWQVFKLLTLAKALGLLDYTRTARGLLVWVTSVKVYAELASSGYTTGHYHVRLAKLLGLNGSIIYRFLKKLPDRYLATDGVVKRFPWLSVGAAGIELRRLYTLGLIDRKDAKFSPSNLYYSVDADKRNRNFFASKRCLDKSPTQSTKVQLSRQKSKSPRQKSNSKEPYRKPYSAVPSLRSVTGSISPRSESHKVFRWSPVGDRPG